ncbi:MAG TPA: ATP-dependent RNA helicase HrpA [Pseudonocardiaceae bacterium]|jgi:ATP-dependent helicase HrpA|nr:ATP-dependent RNA helicase HrpA [Pseudonocardiaceae bacterium]
MSTPPLTGQLDDLTKRLPELMTRDERRLGRRLEGIRKVRDPQARVKIIEQIAAEAERAYQKVTRREAGLPAISYPEALPVSQKKDDLLAAIRDNQVVIVAGETGSGKTTQLPKICLELGRGVRGLIGHTQPRRIAARTVAERIADELGGTVGETVGYQVRFNEQVSDQTMVKLMTDGILLAEIQSDRMLYQYDTLIIDEAHERSLNIDFILGYLNQLLPRRPDLKVIITSATIDPERFARHFARDGVPAPIVEVSGRTYPVEIRYRPVVDPDDPNADQDRDQPQAICDAVAELITGGPGDILVFCSGEREIRDAADAVTRMELRDTEVTPLFARLSSADQHLVFQPHRGRRIVLATNIAETSLTVPGIKYVIDPGTARISRYSHRLKVQRLPIESISQASANQRSGRCGRTSDGICLRLYPEDDFDARPEFTDPEILRTNLASVILQMTAIGLGDIAAFPFIDPPDKRQIADGVQLLQEINALDPTDQKLTPAGRKLAQLPIDPRLGRMVLEAERNGCLREVLVIASALSIQDPRERPSDQEPAADQQHARFRDPESDFLSFLNLWNYLREQQRELSSSRFRKLCKSEFLNYLRVREWQDLHGQLRQIATNLGLVGNTEPAEPQRVHQSLLAGLLSHIGLKEGPKNDYLGARNAKFAVFPGSALFKKPPRWVMAAELVETSRLWARVNAKIEPEWIERLAEHLVRRTYSEPHWDEQSGAVLALEKVTLYGIPIVVSRRINYGRVDRELSRDLFLRHALVQGEWQTRHRFYHRNKALLAEIAELENRARRRDILVDEDTLFDFYDQRVGPDVVSTRHFDSWWKKTLSDQPDLLTFTRDMLIRPVDQEVGEAEYPDAWQQEGVPLRLSYKFEPGTVTDGVTVDVPLAVLNRVRGDQFDWQVPGLREELIASLIKSLRKPLRRNFVPAPDFARAVLAALDDRPDQTWRDGSLVDAVGAELTKLTGVLVPRDAWRTDTLPDYLKVTFRIVDDKNKQVAEGKDLDALKDRLASRMRATLTEAGGDLAKEGLHDWTFDTLPRTHRQEVSGYPVLAYPALVDTGDSVAIRLFDTAAEAERAMRAGTRRLLLLTVPSPVKPVVRGLSNSDKLTLGRNPHGGVAELLADCVAASVDALVSEHGGPAWRKSDFERLRTVVRTELPSRTSTVVGRVRDVLGAAQDVEVRLANLPAFVPKDLVADARGQLTGLVYPGFVTATGVGRLNDLRRYLRALEHRVEKLPENPRRDAEWLRGIQAMEEEYRQLLSSLPKSQVGSDAVVEIRWMIEELRVSYFAQTIRTAYPVSEKRIIKAMDALQQ